MNIASRPHITVAAVVEQDGRFLVVEERIGDRLVINQPAGHLEQGESLTEACRREAFEETGWRVEPSGVVGIYQYHSPSEATTFLRIAFAAIPVQHNAEQRLDTGIVAARWLSLAELENVRARHRSPLVLTCVRDYLIGDLLPLSCLHHV